MPKRVAVLQSSYIPWKGYFDIMGQVDEFMLFDDVQFTRRDWRNRNRIKSPQGLRWLTIPVKVRGRYDQSIAETEVENVKWPRAHWEALRHAYSRAPAFKGYRDEVEALYRSAGMARLSEVNEHFLIGLAALLGVSARITRSTDFPATVHDEGPTARLVSLCQQTGASDYLSGPSARAYIEPKRFEDAGIALRYIDYSGYPEYAQLYPPFEHGVSVLDLLFHLGSDAASYFSRASRPVS